MELDNSPVDIITSQFLRGAVLTVLRLDIEPHSTFSDKATVRISIHSVRHLILHMQLTATHAEGIPQATRSMQHYDLRINMCQRQ